MFLLASKAWRWPERRTVRISPVITTLDEWSARQFRIVEYCDTPAGPSPLLLLCCRHRMRMRSSTPCTGWPTVSARNGFRSFARHAHAAPSNPYATGQWNAEIIEKLRRRRSITRRRRHRQQLSRQKLLWTWRPAVRRLVSRSVGAA